MILNTNATLLDRSVVAGLVPSRVRVHVSLDGPDEESNSRRRTAGGRSSWPAVLRGLAVLKDAGLSLQINATLSRANIGRLEELVIFAAGLSCRRIFLALPDGERDDLPAFESADLARDLVELRSSAKRADVDLFGPWSVAAFPPRPPTPWPPLNVVVRPDGRAFFPHLPRAVFSSVAEAFSSGRASSVGAEWRRTLRSCRDCPLIGPCRGYIKMMVRYHTGSLSGSSEQCGLAVAAGRTMKEERYRPLRTALDVRVAPAPRGKIEIRSPSAPEEPLLASQDVVTVLDWFLATGDLAALEKGYASKDLGETVRLLAAKGILVDPGAQTDARFFAVLTARGREDRRGPIRFGARNAHDLDRLKALGPLLERARRPSASRPRASTSSGHRTPTGSPGF